MERNNRLAATRHRDLKKNSLHCLLRLLPILTLFFTGTLGFSAEKGIVEFMEGMAAQLKEREAFLAEAAEKPLTKNQEKLLTQLLQETESLDVVLSSQRIWLIWKSKSAQLIRIIRPFLPRSPLLNRNQQHCSFLKKSFRQRQRLSTFKSAQISISNSANCTRMSLKPPPMQRNSSKFQRKHLVDPLMDTYSSKMSLSEMFKIMKIIAVPNAMAIRDTDVFRNVWLEHLEIYGPRGRAAALCYFNSGNEFALMRSFFRMPPPLKNGL